MRVFLATAKGDDALRVEELRQAVQAKAPNATVVDGVSDWNENFHRCGGWNGWIEDVAAGRELSGRPRFDAYIAPYATVGRATAQIIERALQLGKPVLHVPRNGETLRVTGVECTDFDSWKAGWSLVTQSPTR